MFKSTFKHAIKFLNIHIDNLTAVRLIISQNSSYNYRNSIIIKQFTSKNTYSTIHQTDDTYNFISFQLKFINIIKFT